MRSEADAIRMSESCDFSCEECDRNPETCGQREIKPQSEEGPYGGAFRDEDDYWNYRQGHK